MPCNKDSLLIPAMALSLVLVFFRSAPGWAENLAPVTWECLTVASEKFEVPLAILISIMATEGGQVGCISHNKNGSYDIGPMQINSIWLPKLRAAGVSETDLRNNGCVNVAVAAWLLRAHLRSAASPEAAIGIYHSATPSFARRYLSAVKSRMATLSVSKTLAKANGSIMVKK